MRIRKGNQTFVKKLGSITAIESTVEERRFQRRVRASSQTWGFSPCGTGSILITSAAEQYGYCSGLSARRALTGFMRMYSRWCSVVLPVSDSVVCEAWLPQRAA